MVCSYGVINISGVRQNGETNPRTSAGTVKCTKGEFLCSTKFAVPLSTFFSCSGTGELGNLWLAQQVCCVKVVGGALGRQNDLRTLCRFEWNTSKQFPGNPRKQTVSAEFGLGVQRGMICMCSQRVKVMKIAVLDVRATVVEMR